jgi:hypothetical protein
MIKMLVLQSNQDVHGLVHLELEQQLLQVNVLHILVLHINQQTIVVVTS